ncbi:hypothetical protein MPNT_50168 [Candidatus Methylacidithermus pantelleriae]|uniref:Uncharacterized protein n=1 Tax=Candidatus Methylacidithermus pantelleriae TaxID=2744239 RepID=A0A8J2BNY6_9BACT|nr:hypothetical protein MPNT_50168 [Candidatus Methylacidithermus pantelleriae]
MVTYRQAKLMGRPEPFAFWELDPRGAMCKGGASGGPFPQRHQHGFQCVHPAKGMARRGTAGQGPNAKGFLEY